MWKEKLIKLINFYIRVILKILTQILKNLRALTNFLNLCESVKSNLYIGLEGVLDIEEWQKLNDDDDDDDGYRLSLLYKSSFNNELFNQKRFKMKNL